MHYVTFLPIINISGSYCESTFYFYWISNVFISTSIQWAQHLLYIFWVLCWESTTFFAHSNDRLSYLSHWCSKMPCYKLFFARFFCQSHFNLINSLGRGNTHHTSHFQHFHVLFALSNVMFNPINVPFAHFHCLISKFFSDSKGGSGWILQWMHEGINVILCCWIFRTTCSQQLAIKRNHLFL